ncbi:hypothetical protein BH23VER1_BH23VER1_06070 [soil metagenome]
MLVAATSLGLAANILVYGHAVGLGWALFAAMLWTTALGSRRGGALPDRRGLVVLGALGIATAMQTVLRPSGANVVCLVLVTSLVAAARGPVRLADLPRLLAEGAAAFRLPLRELRALRHLPAPSLSVQSASRHLAVAWPAAAVVGVFAILVTSGNGFLRLAVQEALESLRDAFYAFDYPSFGRIVFWVVATVVCAGLLWSRRPPARLGNLIATLDRHRGVPADRGVAVWRTRLILAGVNVVYLVANSVDAVYLWAHTELPEELTLASFVHEGTVQLVASTLIAGVLLAVLFRQDNAVTARRGITALALVWIFQNLLLVSSVILRVLTYVEGYGLSLLRVYLVLALVLIAAGFVLLAVAVQRRKTSAWLAGASALACAFTVFGLQFWDARAHVAETNFALAREWKSTHVNHLYIDIGYLASLGRSAYPTLLAIADGADGFAPSEIQNARRAIAALRHQEAAAHSEESWEDFAWHRTTMRARLLAPE